MTDTALIVASVAAVACLTAAPAVAARLRRARARRRYLRALKHRRPAEPDGPYWVFTEDAVIGFTARLLLAHPATGPHDQETGIMMQADTLRDLRDAMPPDLVCVERSDDDHAFIVERWMPPYLAIQF